MKDAKWLTRYLRGRIGRNWFAYQTTEPIDVDDALRAVLEEMQYEMTMRLVAGSPGGQYVYNFTPIGRAAKTEPGV